jgi:beta-galactosidase
MDVNVEPQKKKILKVPFRKPEMNEGVEYRLLISFRLKEKTEWAEKGFEIAWDQLELPWYWPVEKVPETLSSSLNLIQEAGSISISGKDFIYVFDKATGRLTSMKFLGKELIQRGAALNLWRAPLANETDEWAFWSSNKKHRTDGFGRNAATEWYSSGLDNLKLVNDKFNVTQTDDQNIIVKVKNVMLLGTGRGAFFDNFEYRISANGEISINHSIIPDGDMPSWLPRVGVEWILDKSLSVVQWYGRGPQENYPDRKSGYKTGVYKTTVEKMYEPYLIPQDYGLRCDNRWVRMTDAKGIGLEFRGNKLFNFNAHPYSTDNLTKALYTYQLHPSDAITFNLDYATSGVGCTAVSVFSQYQVMPQRYDFTLTVRPVKP